MKQRTIQHMTRALERAADAVADAMEAMSEAMREGDAANGPIVKIKDAAAEANLHVNTIRNLVKQEKLQAVYGGGNSVIGISRESFDRFLKGGK